MRKTSEVTIRPWALRQVAWLQVQDGSIVEVVPRTALKSGEPVWFVWPGKWRTDVFEVDNPEAILEHLERL